MLNERGRVSRPEDDAQNIFSPETDTVEFLRVERIGVHAESCPYAVHEPGRVERWNIRAATGRDDSFLHHHIALTERVARSTTLLLGNGIAALGEFKRSEVAESPSTTEPLVQT